MRRYHTIIAGIGTFVAFAAAIFGAMASAQAVETSAATMVASATKACDVSGLAAETQMRFKTAALAGGFVVTSVESARLDTETVTFFASTKNGCYRLGAADIVPPYVDLTLQLPRQLQSTKALTLYGVSVDGTVFSAYARR